MLNNNKKSGKRNKGKGGKGTGKKKGRGKGKRKKRKEKGKKKKQQKEYDPVQDYDENDAEEKLNSMKQGQAIPRVYIKDIHLYRHVLGLHTRALTKRVCHMFESLFGTNYILQTHSGILL